MVTRSEMSGMNKILNIIRKKGKIHKIDLLFEWGYSITWYEKLKPLIVHRFSDFVRYDKTEQTWYWQDSESVPEKDTPG